MIPVKSVVIVALTSALAGSVQATLPIPGAGALPLGGADAVTSGLGLRTINRRNGLSHRSAARQAKRQANAVAGVINVMSQCGDIGATPYTTATSGPNGGIDWLNCGINEGGWNPPYVQVTDLVAMDLSTALNSGNSPFSACSAYIDQFYRYGQQYNIPPILLASFALQESSCESWATGGSGEQGLMQLTPDKCGEAPNGNCQDPDYNIMTGAKYFSQALANNNGNILLTIGGYNGWFAGLTFAEATAAALTNCRSQNNLDYLQQFVNGWLQNVDAYSSSPPLGKYFNLNQCQ